MSLPFIWRKTFIVLKPCSISIFQQEYTSSKGRFYGKWKYKVSTLCVMESRCKVVYLMLLYMYIPSLIIPQFIHCGTRFTWWRHQMETFSALLAICAGNSPGTGEFLTQRPVTRSFDVIFDLRLNKRLSKQSWGWWFETLSHTLWRQCNEVPLCAVLQVKISSPN